MSDDQQSPQPQAPQPPAAPAAPPAYVQPPAYVPPAPVPPAPVPPAQVPPAPAKKKTGWIIAIVVIAVLLLCCCGAGAIAWFAYVADQGDNGSSSTVLPEEDGPPQLDPEEEARLAEWQKVQDAFVKHDFELLEPDDRARSKATAFLAQVLPDFQIEEMKIEHGEYNEEEGWHLWDQYFVRLSLKSDTDVQTAFSFWIHTAEGDAKGSTRDDITVEENEEAVQIDGSWVIYPVGSKEPLLGGIKDESYANLMGQAMDDFPGGLPTRLFEQDDGTVAVDVETWDSFCWSETFDRIEATYERGDEGWQLIDYKAVIEDKESSSGSGA